jgi:hypothetical protein
VVSIVAVAAVIPLYLDWWSRRKESGPPLLVQRFKEGPDWFIRVSCRRGVVEKCVVVFGGGVLYLKEQDKIGVTSMTEGGAENYRFPAGVVVPDDDPTNITVMDGQRLLLKRKFSGLPITK